MLPSKFPSVRSLTRPTVRAPFGEDAGLVGLPYEKTIAAEPPIPVISSRNHRRATRPDSSSASSNNSSQHTRHYPIVVAPPLPVVAPPNEEHPALRTSGPTPVEEWKRDSGLARSNSSATVREPDCDIEPLYQKVDHVALASVITVPPVVQPLTDVLFAPEDTARKQSLDLRRHRRTQTMPEPPCPRSSFDLSNAPRLPRLPRSPSAPSSPLRAVAAPPPPLNPPPPPPTFAPAPALAPSEPTPATVDTAAETEVKPPAAEGERPKTAPRLWIPPASPKKLVRTFSLRSASRIRTKSLGEALLTPTGTGSNSSTATSISISPSTGAPMQQHQQPLEALRGLTPASTKPESLTDPPKGSKEGSRQSIDPSCDVSSFSISPAPSDDVFSPIAIDIPTDGFFEDEFMKSMSFSNRGSIMIGGRRASAGLDGAVDDQQPLDRPPQPQEPPPPPPPQLAPSCDSDVHATATTGSQSPEQSKKNSVEISEPPAATEDPLHDPTPQPRPQSQSQSEPQPQTHLEPVELAPAPDIQPQVQAEPPSEPRVLMPPPDIRVLAADVEKESQKVRSLYAVGEGLHWEDGARHSYCEVLEPTPEAPSEDYDNDPLPPPGHLTPAWGTPRSGSSYSTHRDAFLKKEYELAGGLEDWEDIDGADVDRYGFINLPRPSSRIGTPTDLKSAQYSPRRRNLLQKRDLSGVSSPLAAYRTRPPSRKVSARSLNTVTSELSMTSMRSSRSVIRQASNLLPHNRDRRWMDEAGDMINASPGFQDVEEEIKAERLTEALKRKEWERSEKWRKMAKVVRKGAEGQGMEFEFDVNNQKVIERTWKGIPDRWRAAAWWSFLASSAKNHPDSATEEAIIADFHQLQPRSSPDDVQIDLDVPRTISRHIMFRKRYRGGQRLLFRVLHALSIYFPETGYVQGMASLAATLLCYFDEEKCFVMLVRMWLYRGLARLYRPGFEDLMAALADFNEHWLNKDVANKLTELGIDPTAYGTRWYLTLFNLSIPFGAQLRVWDVYLLLGDGLPNAEESSLTKNSGAKGSPMVTEYDVLHATSAALAQALRELILDSDFENGMKALTSWIPIKDEDLLMKVTKAEWKTHHGKKRA